MAFNTRQGRVLLRTSIVVNLLIVFLLLWEYNSPMDQPPLVAGLGLRPLEWRAPEPSVRVVEKIVERVVEKVVEVPKIVSEPSCSMCTVNSTLCEEMSDGSVEAAVAYRGTNQRLRRALAKMRSGKPFNVAAIGGSVSKGHTLGDHHEMTCTLNFHRRIFDHLDAKFPGKDQPFISEPTTESKKDEGRNGFVNGAQGGTGSDYFSMCFQEHIPTDVDLVIVELAINDQNFPIFQRPFELLLRGLQDLPSQPAVIYVQVLALPLHALVSGAVAQTGIAQYMDVPTISLQHAVLPQILKDEAFSQQVFVVHGDGEVDARHISRWSHQKMGDLVNAYIDAQLCEMDRIEAAEKKRSGKKDIDIDALYPLAPLPRLLTSDKWDPKKVIPPLKPTCMSMNAKDKPAPAKNDGWYEWAWKDKNYMVTNTVGATISYEVTTSIGLVQLFYLRSWEFHLGILECWLDDDVNSAVKIAGYWDEGLKYNIGQRKDIATNASPGKHMLNCKFLGKDGNKASGDEFRIISVMSI
ncbi:hypothetical protein Q8F55_008346 [Vanrija albida]|uniref:SGNH hydrolase-type esterase domain-containing protein n=1 Tax=Vanrija albida TaxID=181172 RepID=A0ABR3PW76_9TREE